MVGWLPEGARLRALCKLTIMASRQMQRAKAEAFHVAIALVMCARLCENGRAEAQTLEAQRLSRIGSLPFAIAQLVCWFASDVQDLVMESNTIFNECVVSANAFKPCGDFDYGSYKADFSPYNETFSPESDYGYSTTGNRSDDSASTSGPETD